MVSGDQETLIYGIRISSVGPGYSIGSDDVVHNPKGIDLAMKLHYIKGIYFFDDRVYRDLIMSPSRIKEATFNLFNKYYAACGRFRRSEESGRPFIKCNDCGARFIEAQCEMTVDEWLQTADSSAQKLLVSQQVIGPELHFSPPIYLQLTFFKCGGISLGISWAHVLGDVISAVDFMNNLIHHIFFRKSIPATVKPEKTQTPPLTIPRSAAQQPLSIKTVDSVGDLWVLPNNSKMETLSFNLSSTQLAKLTNQLISNSSQICQIPVFELISALLWKFIAELRKEISSEPTTVTLCKHNAFNQESNILNNTQIISTVKTPPDMSISEADLMELAKILVENRTGDERELIEETVEEENGVGDIVFYGANLTFVKWEEAANFYGDGLGFHRPKFVYYTVQGVGDEGAVMVMPNGEKDDDGGGRLVTVILPENEIVGLRAKLKTSGLLLVEKVVQW